MFSSVGGSPKAERDTCHVVLLQLVEFQSRLETMATPHLLEALSATDARSDTKAQLSRLVYVFQSIDRFEHVKTCYFQSRWVCRGCHVHCVVRDLFLCLCIYLSETCRICICSFRSVLCSREHVVHIVRQFTAVVEPSEHVSLADLRAQSGLPPTEDSESPMDAVAVAAVAAVNLSSILSPRQRKKMQRALMAHGYSLAAPCISWMGSYMCLLFCCILQP